MERGYIKLYRCIEDYELWGAEKFTKAQAWVDMVLLANHKQSSFMVRGILVTVERGQLGWSEQRLGVRWSWSREKVRRFLKWLKTRQQIRQQKSHIISIITIINYDRYQQNETTNETTKKQQTSTNKNDKNNKKLKDMPSDPIIDQGFDQFYALYPRKVKKQDALKAWKQVKGYEVIDEIMDALKKQCSSGHIGSEKQFIPYPASWLRGRRWEDEIGVKSAKTSGIRALFEEVNEKKEADGRLAIDF